VGCLEGIRMRAALLLAVTVLLLAPAPAVATPHYGACRRMTRQISHFAEVADLARDRDNELWEEATIQHIGRLTERRALMCPEYAEKDYGEEVVKALRIAARIAAKLFLMGLI